MEYFASEVLADKLTVEQIIMLGGTFTNPAPTDLEFLVRREEVLIFDAGATPAEDWDTVDEWGDAAHSHRIITYSEFEALPLKC